MHDILSSIKKWLETAIPHPQARNQTTQIGVHFEEVAEMMDTLVKALPPSDYTDHFYKTAMAMHTIAGRFKQGRLSVDLAKLDRVEFLDALADQIVTSTGCGHVLGMDIVGATNEVDASNWSKFVGGSPVFDENMKIMKGPDYFKAKLDRFI